MHRQMGQPSLAESLLPQSLGKNERLERIAVEMWFKLMAYNMRKATNWAGCPA